MLGFFNIEQVVQSDCYKTIGQDFLGFPIKRLTDISELANWLLDRRCSQPFGLWLVNQLEKQ